MQTHEKPDLRKEGGPIGLETAAKWTSNYRQRNPNETISHFFGNEILNRILNQPSCVGLRIYYANSERPGTLKHLLISISNFFRKSIINTIGVKHVIIVGVNEDGTNQLPGKALQKQPDIKMNDQNMIIQTLKSVEFVAELGEHSGPCPGSPHCKDDELSNL